MITISNENEEKIIDLQKEIKKIIRIKLLIIRIIMIIQILIVIKI